MDENKAIRRELKKLEQEICCLRNSITESTIEMFNLTYQAFNLEKVILINAPFNFKILSVDTITEIGTGTLRLYKFNNTTAIQEDLVEFTAIPLIPTPTEVVATTATGNTIFQTDNFYLIEENIDEAFSSNIYYVSIKYQRI